MANEAKTAQPGHQQALVGIGRDKDVSLDNKERKINLEQKAPAYLIKTSRHHESSVIGSGGIQLNISGRRNSAEVEKRPQSGHSVALSLFVSLLSLRCNSFTATWKNKIWFSEVFLWQPENLFVEVKFRFWPSDETRFENLKVGKNL